MALPFLATGALPCVIFTIIVCNCCREQALRANTRFVCRVLAAQILLFQGYWSLWVLPQQVFFQD